MGGAMGKDITQSTENESPVENVQTSADNNELRIWTGEILEALINGLDNEYDDGTWGLDIDEQTEPTYDIISNTDHEGSVRVFVGKQSFLITIKEELPCPNCPPTPDPTPAKSSE